MIEKNKSKDDISKNDKSIKDKDVKKQLYAVCTNCGYEGFDFGMANNNVAICLKCNRVGSMTTYEV